MRTQTTKLARASFFAGLLVLSPFIPAGRAEPILAASNSSAAWLSPDAIELLTSISANYAVGTNGFSAKPDLDAVLRMTESRDTLLRAIAETERDRLYLHAAQDRAQRTVQRRIEERVPHMQDFMRDQIVGAVGSFFRGDDGPGLQDLARGLEGVMSGVQQKVNEQLAITYRGLSMNNEIKEAIRALARRDAPRASPVHTGVLVRLDAVSSPYGFLDVFNRSSNTWHHCVFFTRAEMNRAQIGSSLALENFMGLLLPELGFSGELAEASMQAATLRAQIAALDQGLMIYVPEVAPGQRVRIRFCGPQSLTSVTRADISLWCDELAVDGSPVPGLLEMQRYTQALRQAQQRQAMEQQRIRQQQQYQQRQNNFYRR